MSDQGKANYEAYRKENEGLASDIAAGLPEWDALPRHVQRGMDAGADAVEQWLADAPVDEDAPGNEPEAPKVIVVTETGFGERIIEKRFVGAYVPGDFGLLTITRDGREVARYQPHAWHSVHEDGATVPDATVRALAVAKAALEAVARISDPNVAVKLAMDALDEIYAETE